MLINEEKITIPHIGQILKMKTNGISSSNADIGNLKS